MNLTPLVIEIRYKNLNMNIFFQVCDKIHAIADLLKVKYEDIVKKMKEVIAEGKTTAKAIFEAIKKFFFPDHGKKVASSLSAWLSFR